MNLPNKLTVARIISVPFFVFFMLTDIVPLSPLWALIIFIAACITDKLDGSIARKRNLVTDFGKFLDPIADKILVISAMVCLVRPGLCSSVALIIVLAREFAVSSLRMLAAAEGKVLAAGKSGKLKTVVQMVALIAILVLLAGEDIFNIDLKSQLVSNILIWISVVPTVYSGAEYLIKNREVFSQM